MSDRVVVIGGGIVGVCVALELLRRGRRVTLLDPAPIGGEQAASFGNAGWISPASIIPMSVPGLWRRIPSYLVDKSGPLTLHWASLPHLAPFLIRFLLAGATEPRLERLAKTLATLMTTAPARHQRLAEEAGCSALISPTGLLYAYPDAASLSAEARFWDLRRRHGITCDQIDAAALRALAPGLSTRYTCGVLVRDGAYCRDPGGYLAALAHYGQTIGLDVRSASATGFRFTGARLDAVATDCGDIACTQAVVAASIASDHLARQVGNPIPLASERGYHVEVEATGFDLPLPVMPCDGKMANTPMLQGLRAAGQVELAHRDVAPDWRRADILLRHLHATYPALQDRPAQRRWMGHRPSTPDGLPVIGPSRLCGDIVHCFGHGHIGLASAPVSAELAVAHLCKTPPPIDPIPLLPQRF